MGDLEEARAWLRKAEQDLLAAQILQRASGPAAIACFLCQQAIEKSVKALLVHRGETPPRTHDLVELHRRLDRGVDLGVSQAQLASWAAYAVAPRYPGFGDEQTTQDLPPMLQAAGMVVSRVRGLIG